jgi:hypothetical protein
MNMKRTVADMQSGTAVPSSRLSRQGHSPDTDESVEMVSEKLRMCLPDACL